MTDKLDFLDKLPLFANLSKEELEALAQISTEYEFDEGAVLAYQRDVADKLYMVTDGRLFARDVDDRGIVRDTRSYFKGQYFNPTWLFTPQSHSATVRAATDGRVLIIESDDFLHFLDRYPDALDNLEPEYTEEGELRAGLPEEAWEAAQKTQVGPLSQKYGKKAGLMADETVEFATRRSPYLLFLKLFPLGLLLIALLLLFYYGTTQFPLLTAPVLSVGIPAVLVLSFIFIAVYQYVDWANDYFVITNQHIMHYEFELSLGRFGSRVTKTPIDQVQSVEIEKPNLVATLLDVGTARVTTAAQSGIIYFDYIDDPIAVRDTINEIRERVRQLDAGREQAVMREALEDHFEVAALYEEVGDEEGQGRRPAAQESFWERLRRRYSYRVVEGDVVTYRKHIFVLLSTSRWPVMVGLGLLLIIFVLLYYFRADLGYIWLVFVVAILADLFWLVWEVEDWRNDIFQLTSRYVIDIDRSPFGTGESRKQAELSNVQNISSDRLGILRTIFNYGNVYIETAGAAADITFENIARPNQAQQDIFERRERLRQQLQIREGAQRRKEYAVLLDVYQQAVEQGRIPRRTPPTDFEP